MFGEGRMESRGDHAGTGAQRWQDVVSADTMKKVGEARQDPLGPPPLGLPWTHLPPPPPVREKWFTIIPSP